MSEIKVFSWNVRGGGLADPDRALDIAEEAVRLEPQIALFCEATPENTAIDRDALLSLQRNIGNVYHQNYADPDGRVDRHALVVAASPDMGHPYVSFNAGRPAFTFYDSATPFSVTGFHGYDRSRDPAISHDELRLYQVRELLAHAAERAIILGDFNSMHASDTTAGRLRLLRPLVDKLPATEPGEAQTKVGRLGSLAQRLCAMAEGRPLEYLESAGFTDADPAHRPTMRKFGLAVQLDHVMARGVEVGDDFAVHHHEQLSDHEAISVTVAN